MTATTVSMCVSDQDLRARVSATIGKETWANPTFGDTERGQAVKAQGPAHLVEYFMWPVAVDNEAAYEYAVNSANPAPGKDPGVISDEALQSAVQTHWPADPPPNA